MLAIPAGMIVHWYWLVFPFVLRAEVCPRQKSLPVAVGRVGLIGMGKTVRKIRMILPVIIFSW